MKRKTNMTIDDYLAPLDLGYFEVGEAFKGLADENVWRRPPGGLLSVGELAGHIAYWEAVRFAGESGGEQPDLTKCKVKSLLIDARFAYYPKTQAAAPSAEHFAMSAELVGSELMRVHQESVAYFKSLAPDMNSRAPWWSPNSNYGEYLKYAAFHVAYHTGQMYSVRHLLGESPPDN